MDLGMIFDVAQIGLGMGIGLMGPAIAVYWLLTKWEERRRS